MQKSKFQIIILVIFIFGAIVALLMFSAKKSGNSATGEGGIVMVWGTLPQNTVNSLFGDYNNKNDGATIRYAQVESDGFEAALAEAIASGVGPDLVIVPDSKIINLENKLFPIPYESLTERAFRDAYIEQGELFLAQTGVIALPLVVDPLILFYNRDMLQDAGITQLPATWDELQKMTPILTKKEDTEILQSAVALGLSKNVSHSKDIFSLMLLQLNNPIILRIPNTPSYRSLIGGGATGGILPAVNTIKYLTSFTDPLGEFYSWNRAKKTSQDAFVSGELTFYIGYGSEIPTIRAKNPNLNFDVGRVPQVSPTSTKTTFGKMIGVGIVKTSPNFNSAFSVATSVIGNKDFIASLTASSLNKAPVAPARLDLLGNPPENLFGALLYNSAQISEGWLDPSDSETDEVFSRMLDDVVSGVSTPEQAVGNAQNQMSIILSK